MPVDRALAGVERQRVAVGLRHRLVLGKIDDLATPALLDLPQRHHRRRPSGQRGQIITREGLGALRRPGRIAGQVHHAAKGLGNRVVAAPAEILLLAELPVGKG
jgi:hypothetical protein